MLHESIASSRTWTSSSDHMYMLPELLLTVYVNFLGSIVHTTSCALAKSLPHVCVIMMLCSFYNDSCVNTYIAFIFLFVIYDYQEICRSFSQYSIYPSLYWHLCHTIIPIATIRHTIRFICGLFSLCTQIKFDYPCTTKDIINIMLLCDH